MAENSEERSAASNGDLLFAKEKYFNNKVNIFVYITHYILPFIFQYFFIHEQI